MFKRQQIDKTKLMFDNKYLVKLLIPLLIEQTLIMAIGMEDSMMVSSLGETAVSAVSLVDQIILLLITVLTALSTGGAVVVGQYLGQKKEAKTTEASNQLVITVTAFCLGLVLLLYLFKNLILTTVFGDIDDDVMACCNTYYLVVVATLPFIGIYNAGAALFRSNGNSKLSMRICIVTNAINIPGNYIMLHVFGMGVEGVAIPTLVARIVSAVIILFVLRNQKLGVHISKPFNFRPNPRIIKLILRIGIPNGIENGMFQLGKLLLLSFVSTFGTVAITANAVSHVIAGLVIIPGFSVGLATLSIISQCVGADDQEQIRYYTKKLILWAYILMTITSLLSVVAAPAICTLYGLSEATRVITIKIIIIHAAGAIIFWTPSFIIPYMLRACGDVMNTMVTGIASMWIFRIGCGILIGGYMGLGVVGVWIAMIIDWIVRSICFIIRYKSRKWDHGSLT